MGGRERGIGLILLSFATGAVLAALFPLWVLASIEAIILIIIGWIFLCRC